MSKAINIDITKFLCQHELIYLLIIYHIKEDVIIIFIDLSKQKKSVTKKNIYMLL